MPWGAAIAAVGTIAAGSMSADAAKDAASQQADAAGRAGMAAAAERKPWLDAGKGALQDLQSGLMPGGKFSKKFTMEDAQNGPAMQEAMRAGGEAIQNSAAARGGLLSTNTNQDLVKFGQATGAQYENQAFNQWLSQQNSELAATQSLAQVGQTQANLTADTNANAILAAGGANAAGTVGAANANAGMVNGLANQGSQMGFLKSLFSGNSGSNPVPSGGDANGYGMPAATDTSTGGSYHPSDNYGSSGGDVLYSDERLKQDMVRVGHTDDGMPIFRYRMRGGGPTRMGIKAQDMEKVNPSAVKEDRMGFKMVDYSKVT